MTSASKIRFTTGLAAISILTASSVFAQSSPKPAPSTWDIEVGLGFASESEYVGGSTRVSGVAPIVDVSYHTAGLGTISLGARGGLRWTFLEGDDLSFGVALASAPGRVDNKKGTLLRNGSLRLRGMGEIKASPELGVFGHVTVGIPIFAELYRGLGDGKTDAKNFSVKGHGGTRLVLGTELPFAVSEALSLSISPNLMWADKKYTQTYFGVTQAQSARSGFKLYNAAGGIRSLGLDLGAQYKIDKNWSAMANIGIEQLRGDAGKSPLVQKKGQNSAFVGATYKF